MAALQQLGAEQALTLVAVTVVMIVGTLALGGHALGWGR